MAPLFIKGFRGASLVTCLLASSQQEQGGDSTCVKVKQSTRIAIAVLKCVRATTELYVALNYSFPEFGDE